MNVADWIEGWARLTPQAAALRFDHDTITYPSLASRARGAAAALSAAGVGRGDRVAYLGLNSPALLALLFACARLGAVFVPMNWRLAAPEHTMTLQDCTPSVLVLDPAFEREAAAIDWSAAVTLVCDPHCEWLGSYANDALPATGAGDRDPLLLCYTSGSTGRPKGVVLSHEALLFNAINSTHMHALRATDVVLTSLPLFHVGGLNNQTLPALHAGACVVLHPKFDPNAAFDAIRDEAVTLTCLVPAQLDMMMTSERWQTEDWSRLRMIATGSTLIPERVSNAVHAKRVALVQIYGSTETCPIATYLPTEDAMRLPGSAGKAAVHCEVRVAAADGAECARGEIGEILVRGPNVMSGYWGMPESSAQALREGWYHSGDAGYFDAEGFLHVTGRLKDVVISGGENVYPAEIENLLVEHPDVCEAAVVGQPDERWGEIVVAVVVRRAGSTLDEAGVRESLRDRIARYKHPRRVVFVDALPRTALGKVRKEEVRRIVVESASESTALAARGEGAGAQRSSAMENGKWH
ncbi:MAG: long-chain-fatty-acid--CoA ligase [Burkholderiaceae bacterium]|nr:long-chain-fatty-acid--CoA ligase [Burkholderiaceae bacterium]